MGSTYVIAATIPPDVYVFLQIKSQTFPNVETSSQRLVPTAPPKAQKSQVAPRGENDIGTAIKARVGASRRGVPISSIPSSHPRKQHERT